jgi:hypothetical protein
MAARLRKTAVGLRPLCGFLSAKVFCARKMLRIFLIGHKKPSFTAVALGEIPAKMNFFMNFVKKYLTN